MEPQRQPAASTAPTIDPLPSDTQTSSGNSGGLGATGRGGGSNSDETRGKAQQQLGEASSGSGKGGRDGGSEETSAQRRAESGGSETTAAPAPAPRTIRRRNRMITSCLECRRRKMKCDRLHPCTNCARSNRDCVFLAPATDTASRMRLAEVKEQMGYLEGSLGRETGADRRDEAQWTTAGPKTSSASDASSSNRTDPKQAVPEDEKNLRPTEMAVQDAVYEDEADDDRYDLGFKVGKMSMTDRLGGLFRPRLAEELSITLEMLNISGNDKKPDKEAHKKQPAPLESQANPSATRSSSYAAPRTDMLFGKTAQGYTLADFLPSKPAADRVLAHFWDAVHPVAKVVHRPTFESQYSQFWGDISKGMEPVYAIQAIVFAVLFAASISMPQGMALATFGVSQDKLVENFQLATEMALGKANFLKTTKTLTLQAFVMYMIPMCRNEISRAHSTLVGAGIRLAECMGLHRDPGEYGIGPVEAHVRRTIWYQLCFLDYRTGDQQGPRPTIRPDDYTTRLPFNVQDADFRIPPSPSVVDKSEFTDMTIPLILFETSELGRNVIFDRVMVEKETASLTQIISKIESRRKAIYAKYGPMIYVSNPKPIHRAAQLFLSATTCSAYIRLLHPYLLSVKVRIPDRLRQLIISAGTQQLESAIGLETAPELQPWAWYLGNLHQYHTAFLLLFEVGINPMRREADRIWRCLDYIFETPALPPHAVEEGRSEISREAVLAHRMQKGIYVLQQVRDRTLAFQETRKPKLSMKLQSVHIWDFPHDANLAKDSDAPLAGLAGSFPALAPAIDLVPKAQEPHTSGLPQTTGHPAMPHAQELPVTTPAPLQTPSGISYGGHPAESLFNQQGAHGPDYPRGDDGLQRDYQSEAHASSFRPQEPMTYLPDPTTLSSNFEPTHSVPSLATTQMTAEQGQSTSLGGFPSEGGGFTAANMKNLAQDMLPNPPGSEDLPMLDIDWDEWDKLFPPEINTGDLDFSTLPETYSTITAPVGQDGYLPNMDNTWPSIQDFSSFPYPEFTYPSPFSQPQPPL